MTEPIKIKWHQIFAAMLRDQLQQVMITVIDELTVTGEIDIVLLQRLTETKTWTAQQRHSLPDGIRNNPASHVLLEVKITESLARQAIEQALAYDIFYRRKPEIESLPKQAVASFIICAKTPRQRILQEFGYQPTAWRGVYQTQQLLLENIQLIVLNELSSEPHNVFFKLFASRLEIKRQAANELRKWWLDNLSINLFWLIQGLLDRWLKKGEENIMEVLTAEKLREEGKLLKELMLPFLTEQDIKKIPFAQELWQKSRQEGWQKGQQEGWQKGQQEGWQQGRQEGEQRGEQKGRQKGHKALVKTLSRILAIQFQVKLDHFADKLPQLSLESLEALCEVALTVHNLADFEQALQNHLHPNEQLPELSDESIKKDDL